MAGSRSGWWWSEGVYREDAREIQRPSEASDRFCILGCQTKGMCPSMVETRFIASKTMCSKPVCTEASLRLDAMNRVSAKSLPPFWLSWFPMNQIYIDIHSPAVNPGNRRILYSTISHIIITTLPSPPRAFNGFRVGSYGC